MEKQKVECKEKWKNPHLPPERACFAKKICGPAQPKTSVILFYIFYTILILYYTILYYTILYYTILYYTIYYILYYILYYTILYYTILYTILYYTILYYTILYYTILYYTILYYCGMSSCSSILVSTAFDGGNGRLLSCDLQPSRQPGQEHELLPTLMLEVEPDAPLHGAPFRQWFCFRVFNLPTGQSVQMVLANAGKCSFPKGWTDYRAMYTYDHETWLRVDTSQYDGVSLSWQLRPQHASALFAYFAPYTRHQHLRFLAQAQTAHVQSGSKSRCRLDCVGLSVDGATLDVLLIGEDPEAMAREIAPAITSPAASLLEPSASPSQQPPAKKRKTTPSEHADPRPQEKHPPPASASSASSRTYSAQTKLKMWIIGRQHPGETQASWWMEGFVSRLLDPADAVSASLLRHCDFFVVPNMNPDGSLRGYMRSNARGVNLNRAWQSPSLADSPEVFHCLNAMRRTGLDFCLDVHSEEELSYVFLSKTPTGIPGWSPEQDRLYHEYVQAMEKANPEFQHAHGYEQPAPGKANLQVCCAWVAKEFNCLAVTQEQPFKDNCLFPDPTRGWSIERCRLLGRACPQALLAILDELRAQRVKAKSGSTAEKKQRTEEQEKK
eukprot:g25302.t1